MVIAAATFPSWHTALMGSSPPCRGKANLFSGHCHRPFAMPLRGRCAPQRVEARASPRKESAKVRNRRTRRKFNGTPTKPRLSVFCSTDQLYAMLIDDQNKKIIFYASTLQKSIRQDPPCSTIRRIFTSSSTAYNLLREQEAAQRVGEELIKACTELDVSEISSYDRNGFARGERMRAFDIAIAGHGFLPR